MLGMGMGMTRNGVRAVTAAGDAAADDVADDKPHRWLMDDG